MWNVKKLNILTSFPGISSINKSSAFCNSNIFYTSLGLVFWEIFFILTGQSTPVNYIWEMLRVFDNNSLHYNSNLSRNET